MNAKKLFSALAASVILAGSLFAAEAEIISVKGKVEVSRHDAWVALNAGDKVNENEMISTGFQSEAKVKYKDSVMQIGALSRITLSKLASSESKDVVDVYLNTGAVRSKVNHTSDKKVSYTVRSPVAVASVRGTDFVLCDNGSARCFEGAVVLSPAAAYGNPREGVSAEEIADPAEGESDASTAASDIDPYAIPGGVVVLGGQSADFGANGQPSTPYTTAVKEATKAATQVKTAVSEEAVSIGSPASDAGSQASESAPAVSEPAAPETVTPEAPGEESGNNPPPSGTGGADITITIPGESGGNGTGGSGTGGADVTITIPGEGGTPGSVDVEINFNN